MSLYKIKFIGEIVAEGDGPKEAADAFFRHHPNTKMRRIRSIYSVDDLPEGIDEDCYPWGITAKTIGEILEAPNPGHEPEEERGRA